MAFLIYASSEHHLYILDEVDIDIDSGLPLIPGLSRCVPRKFNVSFVFFLFFILMLPLLVGDLGVTLTGSQPVVGELGAPSSLVSVRQRST